MTDFSLGRYRAIWRRGEEDRAALAPALALRAQAFRNGKEASDGDPFDERAFHLLIEETASGVVVACARVMEFATGRQIVSGYSAQHYELAGLSRLDAPLMEVGRLCLHPDLRDSDPLRMTWMAVTQRAAARGVVMLFGCSSFRGVDPEQYSEAFAILARDYLAPRRWRPRIKAARVIPFARAFRRRHPDAIAGLRLMPPLLRSYVARGGRVSDHAVVDGDLDTLHVFTGLELAAMSPSRRAQVFRLAVDLGSPHACQDALPPSEHSGNPGQS